MKNETIVDRVVERIKQQPLGDLITEEDLHDIVKQAIPKAFFEPVKKSDGYRTTEGDPLIVTVMRDLLRDAAAKAAKDWLAENPALVSQYWRKVCDEGLIAYVQKMQNEQATALVREMLSKFVDKVNEERTRHGLSPIYV